MRACPDIPVQIPVQPHPRDKHITHRVADESFLFLSLLSLEFDIAYHMATALINMVSRKSSDGRMEMALQSSKAAK